MEEKLKARVIQSAQCNAIRFSTRKNTVRFFNVVVKKVFENYGWDNLAGDLPEQIEALFVKTYIERLGLTSAQFFGFHDKEHFVEGWD